MSLLLRPIRLILVCGVAFVAGVFYERSNAQDLCDAAGGTWTRDNICAVEATIG